MYEAKKNSSLNSDKLSEDALTKDEIVAYSMRPALASVRFLNIIIDAVFIVIVLLGSSGLIAIVASFLGTHFFSLLNYPYATMAVMYMTYLIIFEYFTGRTVGKFITKTKVICPDGSKPGFWRIVGRTFARLIPFEFFSFLTNRPLGIHDSVSKTMVVNDIDLYDFGERRTYLIGDEMEETY